MEKIFKRTPIVLTIEQQEAWNVRKAENKRLLEKQNKIDAERANKLYDVFVEKLNKLKEGKKCVYYRGFLARDNWRFAHMVDKHIEKKEIVVVHKKITECLYQYIMIKL